MNDHRENTNLVRSSKRDVGLEEERNPLQSKMAHSLGQNNFVSYAELAPPSVQPVHREPRKTSFLQLSWGDAEPVLGSSGADEQLSLAFSRNACT